MGIRSEALTNLSITLNYLVVLKSENSLKLVLVKEYIARIKKNNMKR